MKFITQFCCGTNSSPQGNSLPQGARYYGKLVNGKLQGCCRVDYPNGERYQGGFAEGLREGKGKMYYLKGQLYIGEWKNNLRDGKGHHFYENGERYNGFFEKGVMQGSGVFQMADGSTFKGVFRNNRKHGEGIHLDSQTGISYLEHWQDGTLVSRKPSNLSLQKSRTVRDYCPAQINSQRLISDSSQSQRELNSCTNVGLYQSEDEQELNFSGSKPQVFDIQEWLNKLQMKIYLQNFKDNHIDSNNLLLLKDSELKQLGVKIIGHRKLILREIQELKKKNVKFPLRSEEKPTKRQHQQILSQKKTEKPKKQKQDSSSSDEDDLGQQMTVQNLVKYSLSKKGINLNFLIPRSEIEMVREIGKGAYGKVWQGEWLGQQVAVKLYCKKVRNSHIQNFIEQVRLINKLLSPYILLYMGMYIHNNEYAMVTEYLQRGSLFDHLHKKLTPLTDQQLVSIAKDICLGMIYLHGRNILHCDLKSSNVLIDISWNVKLCDFGLSRLKGRKCLGRIGTVNWMAPQILRGQKFESEADVYSFGMILWEILTRSIPHNSLSKSQIIAMVGYQNFTMTKPSGHPLLVSIFEQCSKNNPKERPSFQTIFDQIQLWEKEHETIKLDQEEGLVSRLKRFVLF